jgi:FKBP-type peptidyl-prolyl cis-trans isomerase
MQMHQYDSAEFVIDAIKFFKETRELINIPEYISNDSLIFNIRILKIISAEEWNNNQQQTSNKRKMQESSDIRRYILDEGIDAKELTDGIYRYIAKSGDGKSISDKSKVTIHYNGKYLDNNIFSSTYEDNNPFSFTIGNDEVINGLEIGLMGMQTNSELTLIIPYDQAYNDEQKGPIPPWTSLVFEIKVLSVN